jgi:Sugar (and other) transporter
MADPRDEIPPEQTVGDQSKEFRGDPVPEARSTGVHLDTTQAMWERRASSLDPSAVANAMQSYKMEKERRPTIAEIHERVRDGSVPEVKGEFEALQIAKAGGWEIEALILQMEERLQAEGHKKGLLDINFKDPRYFTWTLIAFASMGGLLSGLDQSLISGANLYLPKDLGLTVRQNSLVNSAMPLGAVGGALILSPANEYMGRKWAIVLATVLYTIGAALEAGSINFGKLSHLLKNSVLTYL